MWTNKHSTLKPHLVASLRQEARSSWAKAPVTPSSKHPRSAPATWELARRPWAPLLSNRSHNRAALHKALALLPREDACAAGSSQSRLAEEPPEVLTLGNASPSSEQRWHRPTLARPAVTPRAPGSRWMRPRWPSEGPGEGPTGRTLPGTASSTGSGLDRETLTLRPRASLASHSTCWQPSLVNAMGHQALLRPAVAPRLACGPSCLSQKDGRRSWESPCCATTCRTVLMSSKHRVVQRGKLRPRCRPEPGPDSR